MNRQFVLKSLPLLLLCGSAYAGTPIDQKRAVDADARIEVSNIKGAVTVTGWVGTRGWGAVAVEPAAVETVAAEAEGGGAVAGA